MSLFQFKRLLVVSALAGTLFMGGLLVALYQSTEALRDTTTRQVKTFNVLDDLRDSSRQLSNLARSMLINGDLEAEVRHRRLFEIREGHIPRPYSDRLAPGRSVNFLTLLDEYAFSPDDIRNLRQAFFISRDLAHEEREAMRLAEHHAPDNSAPPSRRALHLVFGESYTRRVNAINAALDDVAASLKRQVDDHGLSFRQKVDFLVIGLCGAFFLTATSLLLVGHLTWKHEGKNTVSTGRMYAYVLLVLLATLTIPLVFQYIDAKRFTMAALEKRLARVGGDLVLELNNRTDQSVALCQLLAERSSVRRALLEEARGEQQVTTRNAVLGVLRKFSGLFHDEARIALYSAVGVSLLASPPEGSFPQMRLSQAQLERLRQGEAFADLVQPPNGGMPELIALAPVRKNAPKNDTLFGVVAARLNVSSGLWSLRLPPDEKMDLFIFSPQGALILSQYSTGGEAPAPNSQTVQMLLRDKAEGLHAFQDPPGIDRLGFFLPMPKYGWTVMIASSPPPLAAAMRGMLLRTAALALCSMICAGLLISVFMRRMAQQLQSVNTRMTNLMAGAGIFTWDLDLHRNVFTYDAHWGQAMGLPATERNQSQGMDEVFERIHPDDMVHVTNLIEHPGEGYANFELRIRNAQGAYVWHKNIARMNLDAQGHAVSCSGMGFDITAHKELEQSRAALTELAKNLRKAHESLDNIIEAAELFTFDLNVSTGFFTHNAHWCQFWKYPGPVEPGVKHLSFVVKNITPETLSDFQSIFKGKQTGDTFTGEFQVRICSGELRWCRHTGRVESCDERGEPLRIIGTGMDTTAQKTAEEYESLQRQQLEKMVIQRTAELEESRNQAEAASQAKTVFLSTVSHEIRTPMNAIMGFTHIFERSNLNSTQKEQLEKIRLSAGTLLGVINDVLDISKIEAGKLELEQAPFDLHSLLDGVRSIVEYAALDKGLDLHMDIDPRTPKVLIGDAKRISQILLNLMNNAVKFTLHGSVTLQVRPLDAPPASSADQITPSGPVKLHFRVTDTGIGLSPEQIPRLFQPFMQADSSVTRRFGGTGLGLAISRQLVDLMDGSIGVESELGKGACFHFTLTLTTATQDECTRFFNADAQGMLASAADLALLAGKRVLVVEDNEINQEIACALLEELDFSVDLAANGEEALVKAQATAYDCIFMDMQMPIMDGLEASRQLRARGHEARAAGQIGIIADLASVPIIAMTANAMAEDRQRCLEAGMNGHLGKPIDPEQMKNFLIELFREKNHNT